MDVAWVARHHPPSCSLQPGPASLRQPCRRWVRSEIQDPGVPDGHSFTSSLHSQPRLVGGPVALYWESLVLVDSTGSPCITVGWLRATAFPFQTMVIPGTSPPFSLTSLLPALPPSSRHLLIHPSPPSMRRPTRRRCLRCCLLTEKLCSSTRCAA
jgi:hypothetical protein